MDFSRKDIICPKHYKSSMFKRYLKDLISPPKPRAPDKVCIFISIMPISSPNPMFNHLLESSHRDDSNKWSNIGFGHEQNTIRVD